MNKLRLDNGLSHTLMSVDWERTSHGDIVALRGVIASAAQHLKAEKYVKRILSMYHAQLHEPQLAKDVKPMVRGPYGAATINLIESARLSSRKPFRMPGERETALKTIVDKYLDRGWIRPSKNEWATQAFVLPKPKAQDGTKQ